MWLAYNVHASVIVGKVPLLGLFDMEPKARLGGICTNLWRHQSHDVLG